MTFQFVDVHEPLEVDRGQIDRQRDDEALRRRERAAQIVGGIERLRVPEERAHRQVGRRGERRLSHAFRHGLRHQDGTEPGVGGDLEAVDDRTGRAGVRGVRHRERRTRRARSAGEWADRLWRLNGDIRANRELARRGERAARGAGVGARVPVVVVARRERVERHGCRSVSASRRLLRCDLRREPRVTRDFERIRGDRTRGIDDRQDDRLAAEGDLRAVDGRRGRRRRHARPAGLGRRLVARAKIDGEVQQDKETQDSDHSCNLMRKGDASNAGGPYRTAPARPHQELFVKIVIS